MAQSDWGDIWTWAAGAPPPTDPTKNWVESVDPSWSGYGILGDQLVWEKTQSDNGEFTGRFWDVPGGTSNLMRGRCKLQNNGNWNDRTGIFLGQPTYYSGVDLTGTVNRNTINGVLFGLYQNNTGATRRLYAWRIENGLLNASELGYYDIPPIIPSIDANTGGIFEFEAALLFDTTQYARGGFNSGFLDANRVTGVSYARPFVRWNQGTATQTTSATYVWNGTNTVTTSDTSEVSVGDFIRGTGTINWYRIVFITPNVSVNIDITGRPTPPSWSATADYFDPAAGGVFSDWQLITEVNDYASQTLMQKMFDGEYHVGLLTAGTGWGTGGVPQAVFDDIEFNKGSTP